MKDYTLNKILFVIMAIGISLSLSYCSMEGLQETDPVLNDATAQETAVSDPLNQENMRVTSADQNKILAEIRRATAKYHRIEIAENDDYALDPHCVEVPGLGGMGHHAVNFGLLDGIVDPSHPEVLVYEPMKNGKYQLVAVEFIVDARGFEEDHDVPMLGNKKMDDHLAGPPLGFPHYQLHVWLWKHNPNGIYTPFNPNVNCDYSNE